MAHLAADPCFISVFFCGNMLYLRWSQTNVRSTSMWIWQVGGCEGHACQRVVYRLQLTSRPTAWRRRWSWPPARRVDTFMALQRHHCRSVRLKAHAAATMFTVMQRNLLWLICFRRGATIHWCGSRPQEAPLFHRHWVCLLWLPWWICDWGQYVMGDAQISLSRQDEDLPYACPSGFGSMLSFERLRLQM
jgi:hypothetical protein